MPARFPAADYRFGFNGQEKTDEISGSGNHNTAEFWEYDTRLGRRWNLDPKPLPWESSYVVNKDNPISYLDVLGDISKSQTKKAQRKFDKKVTEPLLEMQRNQATQGQIQAEANKLAKEYQNRRWLHFAYELANPDNYAAKSFISGVTGNKIDQNIQIVAFRQRVANGIINNTRPGDGNMISQGIVTDNTGNPITTVPGSVVNVAFNPLNQGNTLSINAITPTQAIQGIISSGPNLISDPNNTTFPAVFWRQTTTITVNTAGQIQYSIGNSNPSVLIDNWQLNVQVVSPPLLNPFPIVGNMSPMP